VLHDPTWRALADRAAAEIFALVEAERGPTAEPSLRAHAILLLQLRGPALSPSDRTRARTLLGTLVRPAPPYAELAGPWRFAMCSDSEFHEGECEGLVTRHGCNAIPTPPDAPAAPRGGSYQAFEAPFRTPAGHPIQILARPAQPTDENLEMGEPGLVGVLINRHAQLGSFDLRAATVRVQQRGYKLMMNTQCAGLTTRFCVSRMFPDADIYSSWDSTYFRTDPAGKLTGSEGLDCFVAILEGMSHGESFAAIDARIRKAQWDHPQAAAARDYLQFVGPAHPLVLARMSDLNQDGRADLYDGFLDFYLTEIAENVRASATPRDPGVAASQIGGEAAAGLDWAADSLNRVTQYSDIWAGLPGESEILYAFQSGGFYSQTEPVADLPAVGPPEDLSRLPALCHFQKTSSLDAGLCVEVMLHAWLGHAGREYKRLLCAAEAMWRAFDLGHLPKRGPLAEPLGQRGAVLLTLAGLLEFPADQNFLDGLWAAAMRQLAMPEISRSVVRACITQADHDASNYYGSRRGLAQLVGMAGQAGAIAQADPVAHQKLCSPDPRVGRAHELKLP
jgi:hypothetical protein